MNPHQVLGVPPGASMAVIRLAWRRRAVETHPDMGGDPVSFDAVRQAFLRLQWEPASTWGGAPVLVRRLGPPALARRWWRRRHDRLHRPRVA